MKMYFKEIFSFFIVFLAAMPLIITPSNAQQQKTISLPEVPTYEEINYFGINDFKEKEKATETGDPEKQFTLGMIYLLGIHNLFDSAKALKFLVMASDNGYPRAMINMVKLYMVGGLVEHNEEKAYELLRKIEEKNDPALFYRLSELFENGDIGKKDIKVANAYLERSAGLGHMPALNKLAYMYRSGHNIEQDPEKAIEVYAKIYELSDEKTKKEVALLIIGLYSSGKEVEKNDGKALEWLKKIAVDLKDVTAQLRLGYAYRDGNMTYKDAKESIKWFEMASENGSAEGEMNIGYFYYSGLLGVNVDGSKAKEYFYNAALKGNASAAYYLAQMYAEGQGVEKNVDEAIKWKELYDRLSKQK